MDWANIAAWGDFTWIEAASIGIAWLSGYGLGYTRAARREAEHMRAVVEPLRALIMENR